MKRENQAITYYSYDNLRMQHQNYAGFSFESISTLVHNHQDFYEFILITDGQFQHTFENSTTTLPEGTLCLFKPGVTHQLFTEPFRSTHFVMCVEQTYFENRIQALFPHFDLRDLSAFTSKPLRKSKTKYIQYLGESICKNTAPSYGMMEDLFYLCMSDFVSSGDSHDYETYVMDMIRKLDNQLYMNLSAKEIYANYPCSESVLLQHFKKYTGFTLAEYRTQKKMEYACQLLSTTAMQVQDVATSLCYDSKSYFLRTFKKYYHMTPMQYRKMRRKRDAS